MNKDQREIYIFKLLISTLDILYANSYKVFLYNIPYIIILYAKLYIAKLSDLAYKKEEGNNYATCSKRKTNWQ
jgi:hypothetical protein